MNWKVFELKYDKRETWAFEQLSYLLFCAELNNRIGLFRYKNQTGIETETIEKDGVLYGFQAKYYTTSISKNKTDIIDSIQKAKSKNNQLNVVYFYVNQEISESTKKDKKKPQYQIEIEKAAETIGVNLEWRVPSHIELQLSLSENKFIYEIFFNLEPNKGDLLDEVLKHNDNILRAIQTEILFNKRQIKIDRSHITEKIINSLRKKQNIIISGEAGSGKTAAFKEFYNLKFQKIPICIFKATELNVIHINDLFRFDYDFSFAQFLEAYQNESIKVFVIDSAEKLAELTNNDIVDHLINSLIEADWSVVFTTRYAYLNDLSFNIKENYRLSCQVIDIPLINPDELQSISQEFKFILPENQKFIARLRNLFYLREYVHYYPKIDKQGSFKSFVELLWKKRIQNNGVTKNELHLERERCLINLAKRRCETGRFYINGEDLPKDALFQLRLDEILGYDEIHDGYFITHDIYEEWALDKIVYSNYSDYQDTKQFFDDLGNSLPIRRAFRLWLSNQLFDSSTEIESFVQDVFTNDQIVQFWKDELLVSVLLSEYSKVFFKLFEDKIAADNFKILKRILFLLRIACTDVSSFKDFDIIRPRGKGWEEAITFTYKYKSAFFEDNLQIVLPILTDWCNIIKKGETTRYAGLLALSIVKKTESEGNFYMHDDIEEKILKIVYNSANEIELELKEIFDKVLTNKWTRHNDPYEGLCSKILEKPYIALDIIRVLPLSVIQLCNLYWLKQEKEENDFRYGGFDVGDKYGLVNDITRDYFPASAFQTPLYWLLQCRFKETLDFVIDFTNRVVENYSHSDYGRSDIKEVKLHINGKEITQYLSYSLWNTYRGITGSEPYLLQSLHMALEKFLLETAQKHPEITQNLLLEILAKSKTTSLTAVVCSIVLAYPDKFYNIALILFKTIELFHIDSVRSTNELHAKFQYSIGYGIDKLKDKLYTNERLKTCEDKHRSMNIESLFLNYQVFGVKGFTEKQNAEFIHKLYEIIDQHKSIISVNQKLKEEWGILLARMDRRNLTPKISKKDDNNYIVEFTPKELPNKLRKQSEQIHEQFEKTFKYTTLRAWSDFLIGGKESNKSQKYKEYDNNPLLALSETKRLVDELNSGRDTMELPDYFIPAFSCAKLVIEHKEQLSDEDKDFCKEIILSSLSPLFSDEYGYQISDGVEAAIHALPSIINEYPSERDDIIEMMIFILFDETRIGNYKRVCDYVIESIHKSRMWTEMPYEAQAILSGYIKLKPLYKKIYREKRKVMGYWERIPKSSILQEVYEKLTDFTFREVSFNIDSINLLDNDDLEIIYQLIPSDTKNDIHLEIYKKTLPALAPQLLMDRWDYREKYGDHSDIYFIRLYIFRRFANFILQREINEIEEYLKPFIDSFNSTEESASFIAELVSAEDNLNHYDQFWYIWNSLYPKIVELSDSPRDLHLKGVTINYLLAWCWWSDGIEEWHSLKHDNLLLYANVSKELGHIPAVLYSIMVVLNSIGSNFKNEGIDWIYTVVSKNKSLCLDSLEKTTLFYLEKFMRKFIFINRQQVKENIRLKNKIVPILDFMIERGSVHGYLLRESIL